MPKQEERVDIINQAVKNAGERAFQFAMRTVNSMPNPFGTDPAGGEPLTIKEILRLSKGE
jgi:hypothetical protein